MMQLTIRSILIFLLAVLVLGLSVSGAMPLSGANNGKSSFSGQIASVALNPQPEPPAPYAMELNTGRGLFSGQILTVTLNPQPEPPRPYDIENNNFKGLFSGQIQTVTINPPPEPMGIGSTIVANAGS
jgi:hypothetical protein